MKLFQKTFGPMLLSEIKEPFNSKDYIFEMKFDGLRALIFASPKKFVIYNRHKKEITNKYPELKEIQKLVRKPTIFDGEIVAFQNGLPSFSKLQERMNLKNTYKMDRLSKEEPVLFVAFDLLYEGSDLTHCPLMERKEKLSHFKDTESFIKTFYVEEKGKELFQKIKNLKIEGIVAKRKDSIYEINTRVDSWIKIKNIQREEFIIGGYSEKETPFFSAYLGEYQNGKFLYVGKVSIPKKASIYQKVKKLKKRVSSPFQNFKDKNVTYCALKISCYIEFLERTKNNTLRHPVYRGEV